MEGLSFDSAVYSLHSTFSVPGIIALMLRSTENKIAKKILER